MLGMHCILASRTPFTSRWGTCWITWHCNLNHLTLLSVMEWNFFDKDSLENLGHHYQLGHSGGPCPCPVAGPKNFTVFDLSGHHSISINYCNCVDNPLLTWTQLLREGWFPATLSCPQTLWKLYAGAEGAIQQEQCRFLVRWRTRASPLFYDVTSRCICLEWHRARSL